MITVFVEHGLKRRAIDRVPRHRRIPRWVRVRVGSRMLTVAVDLLPSHPGRPQQGSDLDVPSGAAVGNQRSLANVGTVGWLARLDGADPRPVVCGACHVLLRLRKSRFVGRRDKTFVFSPGDPEFIAIHPLPPADALTGFVISGRRGGALDAAVALLEVGSPTRDIPGLGSMGARRSLSPDDLDFPSGPRVAMRVGRGALLDGKVTRYPAAMTFSYIDAPGGLVVEDLIETDIPTQPGDSGALLVDEDIRPLGMLLGAAGGRSYFVHLENVAAEFGLTDL